MVVGLLALLGRVLVEHDDADIGVPADHLAALRGAFGCLRGCYGAEQG